MPLRTSLHRKPSNSRWPSRYFKRKDVLSVNMISLPQEDFRHITHIGHNASRDSFGDLSFLKVGQSLLLQSSQSEHNIFLACSPPPKPPRLNLDGTEGASSPDWSVDQKRKKCTSMPLLDSDETDDGVDKEVKDNQLASNMTFIPEGDNASSEKEEESPERADKRNGLKEEDSSFSFTLDLGPSILDDVLKVMDKLHN